MKAISHISVLALLLLGAARPCYALRSIGFVTKEKAKEWGLEVRLEGSGREQAWLEMEFNPAGELKDFHHVELEINKGEKFLLGYAPLQETKLQSRRVRIRFLVNRAFAEKISLCIVVGVMQDVGYEVRVKEFVQAKKTK